MSEHQNPPIEEPTGDNTPATPEKKRVRKVKDKGKAAKSQAAAKSHLKLAGGSGTTAPESSFGRTSAIHMT
jgi:hypothetical protein